MAFEQVSYAISPFFIENGLTLCIRHLLNLSIFIDRNLVDRGESPREVIDRGSASPTSTREKSVGASKSGGSLMVYLKKISWDIRLHTFILQFKSFDSLIFF